VKIIIRDFPFPPSSNATRGSFFDREHVYFNKKKNAPVKGKMRHYDTAIYKSYKTSCEAWAWQNWKPLREAIPLLRQALRMDKGMLRVDSYFGFHHGNVWTANGKLRRVDAANRVKACFDELAKYLTIDDLVFNVGHAEKCWVLDHEPERVLLVLTVKPIRSLAEVETSILK
jgi:hypothetical protein